MKYFSTYDSSDYSNAEILAHKMFFFAANYTFSDFLIPL